MNDVERDLTTPPARPREMAALGFERRPMVRWLSPGILAAAALRVVASELFGQYADKREFEAALDPQPGPPLTYGESDEQDGALWLDFVADLGDGFDATYAVASLLARPQLELGDQALPRGRALVMGGDQVYPDPSREAYEHRFRGPYGAAFPWTHGRRPDLLAIPGNHDWYDGLTNFMRFFCGGKDIGAWRTRQRRSYFAVRLPHRRWLLGIDIQLDTYIDAPQLEYFKGVGLAPGDEIVLVTGKPCWTKVKDGHLPDSYKNLRYFEDEVVRAAGAEVRLTLTGDLHHYARYAADDGSQLITAGGGGAYLAPTHLLPEELALPDRSLYTRKAIYPDKPTSERIARGAWRLPRLARDLCAVVAGMHVLLAVSLYGALSSNAGWFALFAVLALVLVGAAFGYCSVEGRVRRALAGGGHALAHIALACAPALVATEALGAEGILGGLLVAAATALSGFALGGVTFGSYLVLIHPIAPGHANEVLACQAIADHKNFLRLRLDADGVTIFPVGVPRVPRAWAPAPDGGTEAPYLRPTDRELEAQLIEAPVHVPDNRRVPGAEPVAAAAAGS